MKSGYLMGGLKEALNQEVIKHSASLNRDARYTKQGLLSRLPQFLTIDFLRFYFKKQEQVNCKVLKDCKFPLNLDVYELCTPELQVSQKKEEKRE